MHHIFIRLLVLGIIIFLFIHYNIMDRVVADATDAYAKFGRDLHIRSAFIHHF